MMPSHMVAREAVAVPGSVSCASPFVESTIAPAISNRLETFSSLAPANHGTFGNPADQGAHRSCVASPKEQIRALAELLLPGQPAKVHYPRLHHALVKHCPKMTLRRVRSIYNGECSRLWDDEVSAIRQTLSAAENSKRRADFARAAAKITAELSAAGQPLSHAQVCALSVIVEDAA